MITNECAIGGVAQIKLRDGEVKQWQGTISFVEDSRVFLLIRSGKHGEKKPAAAYPAENVASVEADTGTFHRKDGQPETIEFWRDSIFEESKEE